MKCRICNREIESVYPHLQEKELCFQCDFWGKLAKDKDSESSVRIGGEHYWIEKGNTYPIRGFNGRQFTIRFFDGRVVTTTNLWYQGKIPQIWKVLLLDNAEKLIGG